MKILLLHNKYQFRGGEDVCVEAHHTLLADRGHDVRLIEAANDQISGLWAEIQAATSAVYSLEWKVRVAQEIAAFHPDVMHVHNSFPLLSPSVIYAARAARVPVVQTLHNYRLLCPNALLYRKGRVCEDCVGGLFPWRGVAHKCYRGSTLGTAMVGLACSVHRVIGTYERVDALITLTQFARSKFIAAGFPESNIVVVPNWLECDPGIGTGDSNYVLYAGRLSQEKGVPLLLETWKRCRPPIELKMAGTGPLLAEVKDAQQQAVGIDYIGQRSNAEVYRLMRGAKAVLSPSTCFEGLPRVLVESFAAGTPVIAAKLGSLESLVEHGFNGLHFHPDDADDLSGQIEWVVEHPALIAAMRSAARATYEANYTAKRGYANLMAVYERAIARRQVELAYRGSPSPSTATTSF